MPITTKEILSPTRVRLNITVSPEELKPSVAHAYEHIAQQVQIPGFRKGKVPPPILDQRVGRAEAPSAAVRRLAPGLSIGFLFVDHEKALYLPHLLDLEPLLAPGCVVVADNVLCLDGGRSLQPYLDRVRDVGLYASSTLHTAPLEYSKAGEEQDGVEVSIFRGAPAAT